MATSSPALSLFAPLDAKDLLTLTISCASFVIAGITALHNIVTKSRDALRAARTEFYGTVKELVELNSNREKLKRELGEGWGKLENARTRVIFNDQRELLLSRANKLLETKSIDPTDISLTIIAATLSDAGRHGEALLKYKAAFAASSSPLTKAWNKRQYGRALILNDRLDEGRKTMLDAAQDLQVLSASKDYETEALLGDKVEVYKRLLMAQIQAGRLEHVRTDYKTFLDMTASLRNKERQRDFERTGLEIKNLINDRLASLS